MKKLLPLLLCLLLSIFTVARATKPAHTAVPEMKTAHNEPRGQEVDAKKLLNNANTGEEVAFDGDDSTDPASSDGGGEAPGNEDTEDDHAGDDDGDDDGSGDEGE